MPLQLEAENGVHRYVGRARRRREGEQDARTAAARENARRRSAAPSTPSCSTCAFDAPSGAAYAIGNSAVEAAPSPRLARAKPARAKAGLRNSGVQYEARGHERQAPRYDGVQL